MFFPIRGGNMLHIQYDLFKTKEQCEWEALLKELEETKKSADKVRKGIFARHNELAKMFLELKKEHEILIRNICHGNHNMGQIENQISDLSTGTYN